MQDTTSVSYAQDRALPPWWRNKQLWLAVGIAVAVRLFLTAVWPPRAFSCDLKDFRILAAAMLVGINPYAKYELPHWPPLWLEVLYALGKLSDRTDWQFFTCVRVFLTACDAILILSTFALLRLLDGQRAAFRVVLIGLCLNPFLILLTIQHGNFDVLPTIGIVWFLCALIRHRRGGNPVDWLVAAGWLGLAMSAKTFPLVLAPLLAAEARRLGWKTRLTGAALVLGPTALSLAPLYVLVPEQITRAVLMYRGTAGPMGASALLQLLCGLGSVAKYAPYFTLAVVAALIGLTILLWHRPLRRDSDVTMLGAIVLISVFEFGPGYCPQYWMWVTPPLIAAYADGPAGFRRLLAAAAIIIVITNVLSFGYERDLGNSLIQWMPNMRWNATLYRWFSDTQHDLVLISLPMTAITLLLWLASAGLIVRHEREQG